MGAQGVRLVLTWGPLPKDLDAHIITPTGEVNYNHKVSADGNVTLDHDSKLGNGVETMTIVNVSKGVYKYYVRNFSHDGLLKNSQAKVKIFMNKSYVEEIDVPTVDHPTDAYIWNVLTYDASTGSYVVTNVVSQTIS